MEPTFDPRLRESRKPNLYRGYRGSKHNYSDSDDISSSSEDSPDNISDSNDDSVVRRVNTVNIYWHVYASIQTLEYTGQTKTSERSLVCSMYMWSGSVYLSVLIAPRTR